MFVVRRVTESYRITPIAEAGFAAEITHRDGFRLCAYGFATRQAALEWVAERLVIGADKAAESVFPPWSRASSG